MGDIADMYREWEFLYDERDDDTLSSEYWITKEGEYIKITDMTDSHLLNAYKFLSHKNPDNESIVDLYDEISRRGL